ncbi:histidine kinase [Dactylosporangium sp. NPDC005555]|uniref:sensor histidine kinase n=1 Tax=Dactylosporangium sp. NPDC005555 TaxID=3154889 RepID=UPI0033BA18C6
MIEALRSVWREPRPPGTPARDWAPTALLVPLAVLEGLLRPDLPMRVPSVLAVLAVAAVLPWRRRQPLVAVAVAFGATGLLPLVTGEAMRNFAAVSVLLPVYALTRWGSGREIVLGGAVIAVKIGVADQVVRVPAGDTVAGLAVLSSGLALGLTLRYRAGARRREVEGIRALERERLARDLHDTVAHHVSAMAIRAQAGIATAALHPAAATDALRVIEAEATRALAEMRAMVRVLRGDEPAARAPSPSIGDLAALAEDDERTGPPVDIGLTGDLDGIPPPVGAAIYRLAQESVTNARRHARHATRIEVRVHADDTCVRLRVSDDGSGPARPAAPAGYGLLGMIERAGLLGGTCSAGPTQDGWTVTAVLPRTGIPQ